MGQGESRLLKWIGAATAVLSFAFALQQAVQLVADGRERQRQIAELTAVAAQQQDAADYAAAWASLERALDVAEPTGQLARLVGQLGGQRQALRDAQEDLAMAWLENLRVSASQGETFSDVVGTLDPVIARGIAAADGSRRADLLAHAGWADFLKWRDGRRELDPDRSYAQALQADAANPYANAYRAHWLLWTRRQDALPEAREHFATAVAAARAGAHVRQVQLAAFVNLGEEGDADLVAAVNDMRARGTPVEAQARDALFNAYTFACGLRFDADGLARITALVPAADQIATLQALFVDPDAVPASSEQRRAEATACIARLFEAAGQPEQARPRWEALAVQYPPASGHRLGAVARDALARPRR